MMGKPLYAEITSFRWVVYFKKCGNLTKVIEGKGEFPRHIFKGIPVVDWRGFLGGYFDALMALSKPKEHNLGCSSMDLSEYLYWCYKYGAAVRAPHEDFN